MSALHHTGQKIPRKLHQRHDVDLQEIGLPLGVHLPEVAEVTEPGVVDQCINGDILLYSDMEEQVGTVLFMAIDLPAFWANK